MKQKASPHSRKKKMSFNENDIGDALLFELYKPRKKQITFRLDADILLWLRSFGKGYQTKANSLLREAMKASLKAGEHV